VSEPLTNETRTLAMAAALISNTPRNVLSEYLRLALDDLDAKDQRIASLVAAINNLETEMKFVIVRTYSAGVFAGELESRNGREVVMRNARRLWFWDGAASLSQLATDGTSKPDNCKFPCEVDRVELLEVIEILDVTDKARESIKGVKVWKQ